MIPIHQPPGMMRYHGIAWITASIWQAIGNDSKGFPDWRCALVKYDAATPKCWETAEFVPGSSDPHGLAMHDGALIAATPASIRVGQS